ncbi:MAG: DUF4249 family protein [Spirosomataceae bacterium]|jgi:hypothetical protein
MVTEKKTIASIVISLILLSCKKDLSSPFPYIKDQLVIFSTITAGEPITAEINQSFNPNKAINFEPMGKKLVVVVKENNKNFDTLTYSEKYRYIGNKNVKEGNGYSLHINDEVYGEIESDLLTPAKPNFQISFSNLGKYKSPLNSNIPSERIKVEIDAEPKANKIFKTSILALDNNKKYLLTMTPVGQSSDVSDNCSKFLQDLSYTVKSECINKTNSIVYDVELRYYNSEEMKSIIPDSIIIEVKEIGIDYFKFLSNNDDNNYLENVFKIPNLMPGNIKNALGFFHEVNTKYIILKKGMDYYK